VQALTVLSIRGWERDESSTTNPIEQSQTNLLIQHGYAQHIITASDIATGYYDHHITFPVPYKNGTAPTVVFSFTGESSSASDNPKGASTNGAGENTGRLFIVAHTGFTIRAKGITENRRNGFHWIAIGQQ
jgi:hypothetical protein